MVLFRPCTFVAAARCALSPSTGASLPAPSCSTQAAGAPSSANPPPPSTTSCPEVWDVDPSSWARHWVNNRSSTGGPAVVPASSEPCTPSAAQAASTMDCHPVQRQRWASNADSTACRVRGRFPFSSAANRMRIPGVQKPHWLAPASRKASTQRAWRAGFSPSMVVTERPAIRRTGVTQATRAAPSTQTVQHPHWPWGLQPSLTDRQRNCSRSASRREVP